MLDEMYKQSNTIYADKLTIEKPRNATDKIDEIKCYKRNYYLHNLETYRERNKNYRERKKQERKKAEEFILNNPRINII